MIFQPEYIDPADLASRTKVEIDAWVAKHATITGAPGVGKTYKVQHDYSDKYQHAISFTNLCARQLDTELVAGATIHSKLRLFSPEELQKVANELSGSTIWLDEMSMVNPWIWSVLWVVGMKTSFIFTGDPNQCPPLSAGTPDKLPWSDGVLLSSMLGTATHLVDIDGVTRNDKALREFRDAINDSPLPQGELYKTLKANPSVDGRLRPMSEVLKLDYHIVWANKYRREVNAAVAKEKGLHWDWAELTGPDKKAARVKDKLGRAFAFKASIGLKLVTTATKKVWRYAKGCYYRLITEVDFTSTSCTLINWFDEWDEDFLLDDNIFRITIHPSCLLDFTLGYAVTAPSSQGMTINKPCAVHQLHAMLANGGDHRELAYTAVTRLRWMSQMVIIPNQLKLADTKDELRGQQDDDADTLGTGLTPN